MSSVIFRQQNILEHFVVDYRNLYKRLAVDWLVASYALTGRSSIKRGRS
jgi:hypothetical protein